jgi:AIG2-like family
MVAVRYQVLVYARLAAARDRTLAPVALYAAYGSNLDPAQMLIRCPHSPQRGTGWLEGWRLTFGGEDIGWDGALATVVESAGSRVFVVLYDLSEGDEKELDNWDGVSLGYYRRLKVRVETLDGDALAWLYVLNFWEGGLPSARSIGILADSAELAGAPVDYVSALRALPCAKMGDSHTGYGEQGGLGAGDSGTGFGDAGAGYEAPGGS